jgi:hypothetical protein
MYRINSAFQRHPIEAAIIGRLLAAFGELEVTVCRNAGEAMNALHPILKALYRLRATSGRFQAADALMRSIYDGAGLAAEYQLTLGMVCHCLKIRNQFAHCNWADHMLEPEAGLFFTDLQESAKAAVGFDYAWRHVDAALLQKHESYYEHAMEWLQFTGHELAIKQGRLSHHIWTKPPELAQPPLHNPPDEHVPPWLTADQKDLHAARAQAAQGGAPTPTPGQQDLDKARAEKRAQRQAHREASVKGNSPNGDPQA